MIRFIEYLGIFLGVVVLQILIFNDIHINTFASVNILVLFIMLLPLDMAPWRVLLLSAILGATVDALSGMPAINTISCTFIGFIRRPIINLFLGVKDETKRGVITGSRFGYGKILIFLLALISIQNTLYFTFETMSLSNILYTIFRIITGTISSLLFVFILHLPFFRKPSTI